MGQSFPCRALSPSDQSDEVRTGPDGERVCLRQRQNGGTLLLNWKGLAVSTPQRCLEPSASWPWRGSFQNEPCWERVSDPCPSQRPQGALLLVPRVPQLASGSAPQGARLAFWKRKRGQAVPPGSSEPGWGCRTTAPRDVGSGRGVLSSHRTGVLPRLSGLR